MNISHSSFGDCVDCLTNKKFEDTKGLIRSRNSKKNNDHKRTKGQIFLYKTLHKNTKDRATQSSMKTGGELSCSICGARRATLVTNPVISHGLDCYFIWDMWMIFWKYYIFIARSKKALYLIIHKLYITLTQRQSVFNTK